MTIDFNINLGTVITIAVTQTISTITTFYVLKFLNSAHNNEKVKEVKTKVVDAVKEIDHDLEKLKKTT